MKAMRLARKLSPKAANMAGGEKEDFEFLILQIETTFPGGGVESQETIIFLSVYLC